MNADLERIYNDFARSYDENRDSFDMSVVFKSLSQLITSEDRKLLDLGCGAGIPFDKYFIDSGWEVTGVDFSSEMLKLAKKYVPQMKQIHSDMRNINLTEENFDLVISIYSLFHIPVSAQFDLLRKTFEWLNPGGKLFFTSATREYTGSDEYDGYKEFMGKNLYYSHTTPTKLFNKLEDIGYIIQSKEYHTIGGETFLWTGASKKA